MKESLAIVSVQNEEKTNVDQLAFILVRYLMNILKRVRRQY
jgi:hypothetical protein